MRKRKLQILVGILAVLVVAWLFYATRENDPVYQGKRLSEYLEKLASTSITYGFNDQPPRGTIYVYVNDPGLAAVDQVGTNALPLLVRALQNRESRFGLWVRSKGAKLPLIGKLFRTDRRHPSILRMRAVAAFHRLGPRAAPAIPSIIPLLDDPDCALQAVAAMACIRPERESDIVSLTNVLRIQSRDAPLTQAYAILTLSTFGTKAYGSVPALVDCLSSTNHIIRGAAAAALVRIGAPPERVVPLVIENLPKTNPPPLAPLRGLPTQASIRAQMARDQEMNNVMMTLWALGEYGAHARAALPVISNLFDYPGFPGDRNKTNVSSRAMETAAKILADTNSAPRE